MCPRVNPLLLFDFHLLQRVATLLLSIGIRQRTLNPLLHRVLLPSVRPSVYARSREQPRETRCRVVRSYNREWSFLAARKKKEKRGTFSTTRSQDNATLSCGYDTCATNSACDREARHNSPVVVVGLCVRCVCVRLGRTLTVKCGKARQIGRAHV